MNEGDAHRDILIIKLGALGDFVQALGPMAAIRRRHPGAHITLLTTAPYESLARACGHVDEIWCDRRPKIFDLPGWISLARRLNGGRFSRVYDLQNNDRTALYLRLFRPRPEWIGAAPGASHRNSSPQRTAGHAFDGHVMTLALAGISDVAIDDMSWVRGDAARFSLPASFALLVPGCDPGRMEKRWPAAHYAALAQDIAALGVTPVILGTRNEKQEAATIAATCPGAIDLTGKTSLTDLVLLARGAKFAVGNDTGPMHFIAPAGCPCLVLFSAASDPRRHAPRGRAVTTLQEKNLADLTPHAVLAALAQAELLPAAI